jgi:phosphoribosylanthranilate isomerase
VKICGIREPEHAVAAVEAGADLIGLVFYAGSHRWVSMDAAVKIRQAVRQLDPGGRVKLVGLFVNEEVCSMNVVADLAGLDLIQLSGNEGPEVGPLLDRPYVGTIRAIDGRHDQTRAEFDAWFESKTPPWAVHFDTHVPGAFGGTGTVGNWELAAELAGQGRLILAGGLNPENVGPAIEQVRPFAVDVSSGVEVERVKSPERINAFVGAARSAQFTAAVIPGRGRS